MHTYNLSKLNFTSKSSEYNEDIHIHEWGLPPPERSEGYRGDWVRQRGALRIGITVLLGAERMLR